MLPALKISIKTSKLLQQLETENIVVTENWIGDDQSLTIVLSTDRNFILEKLSRHTGIVYCRGVGISIPKKISFKQ